jgi:lipoprotein-releasing system ATP-binding protein
MATADANPAAKPDSAAPGQGTGVPELVLRAEKLTRTFHSGDSLLTVLAGVDLALATGEMVAVVGPSGAGKSTLLHLLAALDTPTSGTVYFVGKALRALTEAELAEFRNRAVGFVWQRHHLLPDFTAVENVAMPLLLRGVLAASALEAARAWLVEVGLADRAAHRTGELSGGEQQRVAIARALVNSPALLLADEPTGDLDERNADTVFELMRQLHRAHGLTSLLATHNLALARRCDRVLALEHGVLVPGGISGALAPAAPPGAHDEGVPG